MPAETIPLDRAIADARKRFDETHDLFRDPPGPSLAEQGEQRSALIDPMAALDERILALEAVRDELAAAEVIVDDVTEAEVQQIRDALAALDTAIKRTQSFQANLAILTGVLSAASTISGAAKGGRPAGAPAAPAGTSAVTAPAAARAATAAAPVRVTRAAEATAGAPRFVCRMPHHEDLTAKVREALKDSVPVTGVRVARARETRTTRRIRVKCSEEHINVFEVDA
jgi:hypothetical protein